MPLRPPANKKVGQPTSNNNKKQPGPSNKPTTSAGKKQLKPPASTTQVPKASSKTDGYEGHTKEFVTEMLEENYRKLLTENTELREKLEQYEKSASPTSKTSNGNQTRSETPQMQKDIAGNGEHMKAQEELNQKIVELKNSNAQHMKDKEQLNEEIKVLKNSNDEHMKDQGQKIKDLENRLASASNQTKQKETHERSQQKEKEDKSGLELQTVKKENEKLQSKISEKDQELQTALSKITKLEQHRGEIEKKQEEILTANNNLSKSEQQYKTQIESKDKELEGKISDLAKLKKKFDELAEKHTDLTVALGKKETELIQLKDDVKGHTTGNKDNTRGEEAKLRDEVNTLRHRLSQMAGAKLTDNNPSIADLSDPNRATKLSENFSELYDNEWTDALEELMEKAGKTEENGIADLLKILTEAYSFCESKADDFTKELKKSLKLFITEKEIEDLPAEMSKLITDHKKSMAVLLVDRLQKGFKASVTAGEKIIKYTQKCVAVCWFMTIQSPPVYIDVTPPKGNFDKDSYKAYTKSGKTYKFLVWPILYLHKKGPILGKGVAQGK